MAEEKQDAAVHWRVHKIRNQSCRDCNPCIEASIFEELHGDKNRRLSTPPGLSHRSLFLERVWKGFLG